MAVRTVSGGKQPFEVFVDGDKALMKQLEEIVEEDAIDVMTTALWHGIVVIRDGIRAETPIGETRRLREAIGSHVQWHRNLKMFTAKAGINVNRRWHRGDPNDETIRSPRQIHYGVAVAMGTKRRTITGKRGTRYLGANRGRLQPNNFVNRGAARTANAAVATIKKVARRELKKVL